MGKSSLLIWCGNLILQKDLRHVYLILRNLLYLIDLRHVYLILRNLLYLIVSANSIMKRATKHYTVVIKPKE